jgi:cyclopropane fatty-acyl-phospholipid synthase-like methyltransferase
MTNITDVITYYAQTAARSYDRWASEMGEVHFGYFENTPNMGLTSEELNQAHIKSFKMMADKILELVSPEKGEIIIDNGCGNGSLIPILANSRAAKIIGTNVVKRQLDRALQLVDKFNIDNALLLEADFRLLPLKASYADKILFMESIAHSNLVESIASASRVLKKAGKLIIVEPMLYTQNLNDERIGFVNKGMSLNLVAHDSLIKTLNDNKLKIILDNDIVDHVLPSIQIAFNRASSHRLDDSKLALHRSAVISHYELTVEKKMGYFFLVAEKI